MSKGKKEKSLLDLITAENIQKVNSDKEGLEESIKRFNEVTEFLFATNEVQKVLKEKDKTISDLEAKLAESEKNIEHWHKLYNERDKQFQSVRQRYHLLNKLQSNYDKKDKLHLAYMQCLELVDENEQLKQQLAEKETRIAELEDKDWYEALIEQLEEQNGNLIQERDKLKYELEWAKNDLNECAVGLEQKYNQDKISFAVEQISRVKEMLYPQLCFDYSLYLRVMAELDNQIKQLKEGN